MSHDWALQVLDKQGVTIAESKVHCYLTNFAGSVNLATVLDTAELVYDGLFLQHMNWGQLHAQAAI